MTREEAIAVLEGLSDNPLFSNQHKAAFNIAIHDIKQRHDWDINNLILINKDNYEPLEQEPVLDKIRAEIESQREEVSKKHSENEGLTNYYFGLNDGLKDARDIIDKYKAESEDA